MTTPLMITSALFISADGGHEGQLERILLRMMNISIVSLPQCFLYLGLSALLCLTLDYLSNSCAIFYLSPEQTVVFIDGLVLTLHWAYCKYLSVISTKQLFPGNCRTYILLSILGQTRSYFVTQRHVLREGVCYIMSGLFGAGCNHDQSHHFL